MSQYIDAHAHLNFLTDEQSIHFHNQNIKNHVSKICYAGYSPLEDLRLRELMAVKFQASEINADWAIGLHPWYVIEKALGSTGSVTQESFIAELTTAITSSIDVSVTSLGRWTALGEVGLDFYKSGLAESSVQLNALQVDLFQKILDLNKNLKLPLVLHIVRAHQEAIKILKEYNYKGLVHSFVGNYEQARDFIDMGYKISIAPRSLKSKKTREAFVKIPLEHVLLESDSEDGHFLLDDVYKAAVEIKGLSLLCLQEAMLNNYNEVFS